VRKNTYAMRYVAGMPAERILPPGSFASISQALPAGTPLSSDEKIRVLVWNIFKQQRAEWLSVLKNFGKDAHLVLLQEAQTTPELVGLRPLTILPPIRCRRLCCRSTPLA
jgi:endonuclease/exonuclease/phosphatase (EEP) superfamily protein YafD